MLGGVIGCYMGGLLVGEDRIGWWRAMVVVSVWVEC
ncbi:hypothetical protein Victoria_0080 [Pseudomonas phage Victoria]|nr:hypothetical protein Victoria_0080 [Pseudomonas phage Victoria]